MANAGKGKKAGKKVVNVGKGAKQNLQQGYKKGPKYK